MMEHWIVRIGLRCLFFTGLSYGYLGTARDVPQWLGFMLIAEGLQFVARTAWQWEAEERTAARRRECRR